MGGTMGTKIDDDPEGQWIFPSKELTDDEKLEIVARCVEIATRIVLRIFVIILEEKLSSRRKEGR